MKRIPVVLLFVLIAVVTAACGGGPSADVLAFCDTVVAAEAQFSGEPDPATVEQLLADADSSAPRELSDEVATITAAARTVLETGDFSAFDDEFLAAEAVVDEYMADECGYDELEVTAVDYTFQDVPETVRAGVLALQFSNEGTEGHEISVLRINDGVTETIGELLQLPEEEAMSRVTFVGGDFAMPGESTTTFVDLEPGEYAFVCFVPVGATPENIPAMEAGEMEGGAPHFTEGMVARFTVEG